MGYVAWSVVFGEQPSASKWNILGANDASFNDGTGIADDVIIARHLGDASVKKATIDYTDVDVYSTSEVDTGKKWTDGRAIYRKVLIGTANLAVGTNNIAHGISGITNLELVNFVYSIRLSTTVRGAAVATAWHREAGGNWSNPVVVNGTNVQVYASFAWGNSAYTIILEYVK